MRLLGIAALAVAATISTTVPAHAAEVGEVVSVRSGCGSVSGTITLSEERTSEDQVHVEVAGRDLPNGELKAIYTPDLEQMPDGDPVRVQVVDHRFRLSLDVDDDGSGQSALTLWQDRRYLCMTSIADTQRYEMAIGSEGAIGVFHRKSGKVGIKAYFTCDEGTRWRWRVKADFADGWLGAGRARRTCSPHGIDIPWVSLQGHRSGLDEPTALRLVARSGDDVRRITYWVR